MNGRVKVHDFDLALKLVTLYPSSRTFASLIADEYAGVNYALLFWFRLFV
jgi:hypothetical protein